MWVNSAMVATSIASFSVALNSLLARTKLLNWRCSSSELSSVFLHDFSSATENDVSRKVPTCFLWTSSWRAERCLGLETTFRRGFDRAETLANAIHRRPCFRNRAHIIHLCYCRLPLSSIMMAMHIMLGHTPHESCGRVSVLPSKVAATPWQPCTKAGGTSINLLRRARLTELLPNCLTPPFSLAWISLP